jgi:hypothetical protein
MKTADLTGAMLDYWVARAEGVQVDATCDDITSEQWQYVRSGTIEAYTPSSDWAQGGPIIERERISVWRYSGGYDYNTEVWFAADSTVYGWDDGSICGNNEG